MFQLDGHLTIAGGFSREAQCSPAGISDRGLSAVRGRPGALQETKNVTKRGAPWFRTVGGMWMMIVDDRWMI